MTTATLFRAPALAALVFCAGLAAAQAAPAIEAAAPAAAAPTLRAIASVTDAEEDAAACSKSRRRLWVEGEGWIVRRVTTCR